MAELGLLATGAAFGSLATVITLAVWNRRGRGRARHR